MKIKILFLILFLIFFNSFFVNAKIENKIIIHLNGCEDRSIKKNIAPKIEYKSKYASFDYYKYPTIYVYMDKCICGISDNEIRNVIEKIYFYKELTKSIEVKVYVSFNKYPEEYVRMRMKEDGFNYNKKLEKKLTEFPCVEKRIYIKYPDKSYRVDRVEFYWIRFDNAKNKKDFREIYDTGERITNKELIYYNNIERGDIIKSAKRDLRITEKIIKSNFFSLVNFGYYECYSFDRDKKVVIFKAYRGYNNFLLRDCFDVTELKMLFDEKKKVIQNFIKTYENAKKMADQKAIELWKKIYLNLK